MNILIVNQHLSRKLGGSEIQCDIIANELALRGHEVLYYAVGGADEASNRAYRIYSGTPNLNDLHKACKAFRPHVAYWRHNRKGLREGMRVMAGQGIPVVFAVSNANDLRKWAFRDTVVRTAETASEKAAALGRELVRCWRHRLSYSALRRAAAITVLNEDLLPSVSTARVRFIPNTVSRIGKNEFVWHRPYVMWAASLKPIKRPECYISLASKLDAHGVDFLMVGEIQSDRYAWVREAAALPSNCYYLGSVPPETVNGMLENALMLVHTCEPEGFGNVFIQAWMAGVPTVSLSHDPGGYILKHDLGFVSGSLDQLETDVRELLNDDGLRKAMGAAAKAFASEVFDVANSVGMLEELLEEVARSEHDS